jgi:putative transposase
MTASTQLLSDGGRGSAPAAGDAAIRAEAEPGPIRTYTLKHDRGDEVLPLLIAYRRALDSMLEDIWGTVTWKAVKIDGKKQFRLLPRYRKDKAFRKLLRDKYLEGWAFAAHWVDSALATAFSMMESWRKNYNKGYRKRKRPVARRLFARAPQDVCKLEGEGLRVTLAPGRYVWFDLSRRYFPLPREVSSRGIGQPVITPNRIHIPVHVPPGRDGAARPLARAMAWDSNLLSLDGYSPETGWVRIDTRALATIHISSFEKRRSVQRKLKGSRRGKRVLAKYSRRERSRARKHVIEIARVIGSLAEVNGFEELRPRRMYTRSRVWNRRVMRADWRSIAKRVEGAVEVPPRHTSDACSRCGWVNRDLRGSTVFRCARCGLTIDRQLNAAINLYLRMEGVPHQREWWDENVLPSLVGGYLLTGAERRDPDELARGLYDAVKPKLYAYDRYADAYLLVPT